jgi:hypothetical protein
VHNQIIFIGLFTLLLAGCKTAIPPVEVEEEIAIPPHHELKELKQEAKGVQGNPEITESEALKLLYEEAVAVRDIIINTSDELDTEAQAALVEPIEAFSADVELLEYYMRLADREPLLDDDHRLVVGLTADIEEAIAFFAQALEILL